MQIAKSRTQYAAMNEARSAEGFGPLFESYEAYYAAIQNDNNVEKIEELKALIAAGEFHHATHRFECGGMLAIYTKQDNGFNGFTLRMTFGEEYNRETHKRSPHYDAAYALVRNSGVSVGARGEG